MNPTSTHTYHIGKMDCANCAKEVQDGVARLDGVQAVHIDFASARMTLEGDVPFDVLRERVQALGKTVRPADETDDSDATPEDQTPSRGGVLGFWDHLLAQRETRLALLGGAVVLLTLLVTLLFSPPETLSSAFYVLGMLITAAPIARSGLNALRINRTFNINLLMTIAAVGAIILGEYLESATVIFLFAIGEALEGYTTQRARDSIRSLLTLRPARALRVYGQLEEDVPVEALAVDDVILIKPGERIPMDGVVLRGESGVNQAPITGESLPVTKTPDDEVFAGTLNGSGSLHVRVTQLAKDNTLNRIIRMVEEAQNSRAPSQRLIDRFAHYYTPAVVILAALVAFVPPVAFGLPFWDGGAEHGWLYRALSMLVIACPCALVISTPVTIISSITSAARRGVLIKGGAHLEALGRVKAVAFDKTGTLTRGEPTVTRWRDLTCAGDESCAECDDVLALASAVERRAHHPLAEAVTRAATQREVAGRYPAAEGVELLAGQGVRGHVAERVVTVGSHAYFDAEYPHAAAFCANLRDVEASGQTAMLLHDGEQVRGFIAVADTPRADSVNVVRELHELGLTTVMLTGDNRTVAQAIAAQVGVDDVRAQLMPEDKVTAVRELLSEHGAVAMVGDGVNDTPALALASVGVAMGGAGSAQALETADVALMADDIARLPFALRLGRFARRLIVQNIALAFGVKAVFLVLAFFGLTTLWVAVLADMGMSLLVTLNGMRPLRQSA